MSLLSWKIKKIWAKYAGDVLLACVVLSLLGFGALIIYQAVTYEPPVELSTEQKIEVQSVVSEAYVRDVNINASNVENTSSDQNITQESQEILDNTLNNLINCVYILFIAIIGSMILRLAISHDDDY